MSIGDDARTALPAELLFDIFSRQTAPPTLMSLALVCRRWKEIIYGNPVLWTDVAVAHNTTEAQIRTQLARSGSRQLAVHMLLRPSGRVKHGDSEVVIALVLAEATRIGSLEAVVVRPYSDYASWDYDTGNDDDDWPAAFVNALGNGEVWLDLRTLVVEGDILNRDLEINVFAPALRRLQLNMAAPRSWEQFGLGSSLQDLELTISNTIHELMMVIHNCSQLRRISFTDTTMDDETFLFDPPRQNLATVFPHLCDLAIHWQTVDLPSFLRLLACCPQLERLQAWITSFVDYHPGGPHALSRLPPFKLRSLKSAQFSSYMEHSMGLDMLSVLSPTLSESTLSYLDLESINIDSFERLLGPELRRLRLDDVVCDAHALAHGLAHCTKLTTLELSRVSMPSLDDSLTSHVLLPRLGFAVLSVPRRGIPEPDLASHNRHLARFFLSMVDGPGVPSISISGVAVTDKQMIALVRNLEVGGGLPVLHVEGGSDFDSPEIAILKVIRETLSSHPVQDSSLVFREFAVANEGDAWSALHFSLNIFDHIGTLNTSTRHLAAFFAALPITDAQLPVLSTFRLRLRAVDSLFEDEDEKTLKEAIGLRAARSVRAPRLRQITFSNARSQLLSDTVARFTGLFDTPHELRVALEAFMSN